ncbi:MAG: metallophosphoesterase [Clostridia bacterium]|nr:metallophosphoesterase [Clostridia bacterium]
MDKKRVLLVSDTHHCHHEWYGVGSEERMERLARHIAEEYERDPFALILFLGDYSLDHWKWQIGGSWVAEKRSYTKEWLDRYADRLPPVPYYLLAGNHEQYGEVLWEQLTGCKRETEVVLGEYLFILWDAYGGELDPDYHHDGVYTPLDVERIRQLMAEHADKRVILCSHHVAIDREQSEQTAALLADPRIVCLFAGHTHRADVRELHGKKVIFTGNYSYCDTAVKGDPRPYMWGFRDLYLDDTGILTRYIIPENTVTLNGEEVTVPYHVMGGVEIKF